MRLDLTNAGTHEHAAIDIADTGATEIAGPSAAGKSSLIDLHSWAWSGKDRHGLALTDAVVRRGASTGKVAITFGKGTRIERVAAVRTRKNRAGDTERVVDVVRCLQKPGGDNLTADTDKAFDALLNPPGDEKPGALAILARDPEVVRTIAYPGVWQRLASAKLGGAALRDVLGRILPKGDLRGEVAALMKAAGHDLAGHDPTDAKIATDRRGDAKKNAATAEGRLSQARATLASIEGDAVAAPSASDVTAAKRLLILAEAWGIYDGHLKQHEAAKAGQDRAIAARESYRARKAALGERPTFDSGAIEMARIAAETAERNVRTLESELRDTEAKERAAEVAETARLAAEREAAIRAEHAAELAKAKAAPVQLFPAAASGSLSTCPACGQSIPGAA